MGPMTRVLCQALEWWDGFALEGRTAGSAAVNVSRQSRQANSHVCEFRWNAPHPFAQHRHEVFVELAVVLPVRGEVFRRAPPHQAVEASVAKKQQVVRVMRPVEPVTDFYEVRLAAGTQRLAFLFHERFYGFAAYCPVTHVGAQPHQMRVVVARQGPVGRGKRQDHLATPHEGLNPLAPAIPVGKT